MSHPLSPITQDKIDPEARKVVMRLQRYGHEAYMVGGCVRDLLLGQTPKDFDVSTSATPKELRKLFRNCRIIGRRFELAHIFFGRKIIETATFRAPPPKEPEASGEQAIIWRDNVFGTAQQDAQRRDFTINGLFYDPAKDRVIDHVGGQDDLHLRRVRTIGEPRRRLQEDPVRILRAIKFAARLGLTIEPATWEAMVEFRGLVAKCAPARVLEEIYRLLGGGNAAPSFDLLHRCGLIAVLFPEISDLLPEPDDPRAHGPVAPIQRTNGSRNASRGGSRRAAVSSDEVLTRRSLADVEQLHSLIFDQPAASREQTSRWMTPHLEALDRLVRDPHKPPSHSFLLGTVLYSLASPSFDPSVPTQLALERLDGLVDTVCIRLGTSRRDREELRQLLHAQRRMLVRGRRTRPRATLRKDYFPDAFRLMRLSCEAADHDRDALAYWIKQGAEAAAARPAPKRPPRRSRRGRRPRHPRQRHRR